jgi:serine/threonine protein kinase
MSEGNESLVGTEIGGRYRLLRFVARGGMGEVFEAYDQKRQRQVAVKLLREELSKDPEWCARFKRESEVASAIQSPYVARVLNAGQTRTHAGRRWIAFEFLTGDSLDTLLRQTGKLPFAEVGWMVEHLLMALESAHGLGVIHRDIKPGNLFVVPAGPRLVVLDFGVAKRAAGGRHSSGLTSADTLLGTPSYMSPEQLVNSKGVDVRTDLYSAGLVAYRTLTGRLPFQHRDWAAMLESKRRGSLPPLASASGISWPETIEAWILHMVAARREDRFDSAQAALRAWRSVSDTMRTYSPRAVPDTGDHRDTDVAPITEAAPYDDASTEPSTGADRPRTS